MESDLLGCLLSTRQASASHQPATPYHWHSDKERRKTEIFYLVLSSDGHNRQIQARLKTGARNSFLASHVNGRASQAL